MFGFWALVLVICMFALIGSNEAVAYVESRNMTEPMFVFCIMVISATRPVLQTVMLLVRMLIKVLPLPRTIGFYLVTVGVVPLMGSIITEPAAMTLAALIISDKLFSQNISNRLKYATLGILFTNISIGGLFTNFAAAPVLMVATKWDWSSMFMIVNFGWKAGVAIMINTLAAILFFRKELMSIEIHSTVSEREPIPLALVLIHLGFMFGVIAFGHYPSIFLSLFLFFLGITHAYQQYQDRLMLREGLLVAFFLAGLVVLGGQQQWWLQPLLTSMSNTQVFFGAIALGAVTDNAALTYLGSLVEGISDDFKYALVAGAMTSGGLTIIANAPNPAGIAIMRKHFDDEVVSPLGLLTAAIPFTVVAGACLILL